jgi:hypothetical protein
MAKLYFTFLFVVTAFCTQAQNVGIGTTTPNTNAALEISSNSKGLLIPRTSSTSRTAIANPPKGLMVYDSSFSAFYYYDGGRWLPVGDKNYDSSTVDYFNVNGASVNLPTSTGGVSVSATGNSGFIFDNGGPGIYSANNSSSCFLIFDDSTLQIKITIEEMNAENLNDNLYILQSNGVDFKDTLAIFTGTQTGTVIAKNDVKIYFKSNASNEFAGFKIRWGRLRNSGASQTAIPFYGWHFNNSKLATMGGMQKQNNWHKDSVGFGSFNYGIGNKAKGKNSFAVGNYSNATGDYSTSMGSGTDATGNISIAMGDRSSATGSVSTAMGDRSSATGSVSTAMGYKTTASGAYSTAMGKSTVANGDNSTAIGNSTTAIGDFSTAIGYNTKASGEYSNAIGYITTASGQYSTAIGYLTTAYGYQSTAMGVETTASSAYSTAMGVGTIASGLNSTAMGSESKAKGSFSTATGLNSIANGNATFVAGMYNDSIVSSNAFSNATTPLFIIGNGNNNADRSNAFVVLKNGNVAIGDNGNPVNRLHITGGTGASLSSSSGYITTGFISSTNMVIDNNELQVRLNGAASDLYLQNNGGNIAVGNTGVPAYQLELSTNSAGKPGSSSWSIASDSRLKQNINPYTQGLQQLLQINPVTYQYNEKSGFDTKPEYVGIIAQDLQKIAPYMVSTVKRKDAEYLSVDNGAMTYMLINAVKELKEQVDKQNEIIIKLQQQIKERNL